MITLEINDILTIPSLLHKSSIIKIQIIDKLSYYTFKISILNSSFYITKYDYYFLKISPIPSNNFNIYEKSKFLHKCFDILEYKNYLLYIFEFMDTNLNDYYYKFIQKIHISAKLYLLAEITEGISKALHILHKNNVIHNNVTAENILIKKKSNNLIKIALNNNHIIFDNLIYSKHIFHKIPLQTILHLNNNKSNTETLLKTQNFDLYCLIFSISELITKDKYFTLENQDYIKNFIELLLTNSFIDIKKINEMKLKIIKIFDDSYRKLKIICQTAISIIDSIKIKTKLLLKIKSLFTIIIEVMNPNIQKYPNSDYVIQKLKVDP